MCHWRVRRLQCCLSERMCHWRVRRLQRLSVWTHVSLEGETAACLSVWTHVSLEGETAAVSVCLNACVTGGWDGLEKKQQDDRLTGLERGSCDCSSSQFVRLWLCVFASACWRPFSWPGVCVSIPMVSCVEVAFHWYKQSEISEAASAHWAAGWRMSSVRLDCVVSLVCVCVCVWGGGWAGRKQRFSMYH